ncbi:MAG TPA: hypothetical protein VIG93_05010 [Gaiellaceae bacterium]
MVFEQRAAENAAAHQSSRRRANERKAAETSPATDPQGLVEFACECNRVDCEKSVRVPSYVYRRMVEAGDQYLLQAGHHAFAAYRTIVTIGLVSIEERA